MKDKFGQFEWHCAKDCQPDDERYVYFHNAKYPEMVEIEVSHHIEWQDHYHWCYVFMPDAPNVEKKMTLEERLEKIEKEISELIKWLKE